MEDLYFSFQRGSIPMKAHQKEIKEIRENAARVDAAYTTQIEKAKWKHENLQKEVKELQGHV